MVDIDKLRMITEERKRVKAHEERERLRVEEELRQARELQEKLAFLMHVEETIAYIDKQIVSRAEKGENSYTYDFNQRVANPELLAALKVHYKELSPANESIYHEVIANYEMDTYNEYTTHGLNLRW